MADFGLIRSFDIDHGELDGLSRQQCFVLGYELAEIGALLKKGEAVSKPVHALNRLRIEKSCRDAGRQFRLSWVADDPSETTKMLLAWPDRMDLWEEYDEIRRRWLKEDDNAEWMQLDVAARE